MGTLTGAQIRNTYDGLLKTTDSTQGIPVSGRVVVQDGVGNNSALSVGRSTNGIESSGDVKIDAGDLLFTYNDQERFIKGDVNGGAIKFVGNSDNQDNPERGIFIGRSDNNGAFTSAIDVRTDLNVEIQNNLLTDHILAKTNSGTTGVVEFSDEVNFQNPVTIFDGMEVSGNLNQNSGNITSTSQIQGATIKATGSIGVNVTGAPSRPLDVQGNTRLFGNVLMDKSTSKLGIRLNDPQYPLEVNGTIRSNELNIGNRLNGALTSKRIYTGTTQDNKNFLQFSDYGSGNLSSMNPDKPFFTQATTASFSQDGKLMEDWLYKWVRIKPSWWGVQTIGEYKTYTILTAPNDNTFVLVDEILVIDNKDIYTPTTRGNFVGPDADPWLGFFNRSGAEVYDRQIAAVTLGTYRAEQKKWAYLMRSNENVQINNNFLTTVQRSGNTVQLRARTLNTQTIRPNYNVEFRIKYKIFKTQEQTGYNPTTLQ